MHAQRNVSNSSGAIPNINTTRILEKEANWSPKNDHTHSLIPLCTYLYVFMPNGMQGSEEPRDQRNLSRPSPADRKEAGTSLATRDYVVTGSIVVVVRCQLLSVVNCCQLSDRSGSVWIAIRFSGDTYTQVGNCCPSKLLLASVSRRFRAGVEPRYYTRHINQLQVGVPFAIRQSSPPGDCRSFARR